MNGIDVSGWQKGICIDEVPCDFVISKATQGVSYVNDDCDRVIQACKRLGKCWGFYHYIDGSGADKEARYFADTCKGYLYQGVPCLDWERVQNKAWGRTAYLDELVKRFIDLTGVPPIIYASLSDFPWDVASGNNCGVWVAQYANSNQTGYQANPWNEGAYNCVIRQYSSNGRLSGYDSPLDLNKAYIDAATWGKYANPHGAIDTPQPAPSIDVDTLAYDTITGKYGNGSDRRDKLGSNYDMVQARVNELLEKANNAMRGDYGNGDARRNNLGSDYSIVQCVINYLLR